MIIKMKLLQRSRWDHFHVVWISIGISNQITSKIYSAFDFRSLYTIMDRVCHLSAGDEYWLDVDHFKMPEPYCPDTTATLFCRETIYSINLTSYTGDRGICRLITYEPTFYTKPARNAWNSGELWCTPREIEPDAYRAFSAIRLLYLWKTPVSKMRSRIIECTKNALISNQKCYNSKEWYASYGNYHIQKKHLHMTTRFWTKTA